MSRRSIDLDTRTLAAVSSSAAKIISYFDAQILGAMSYGKTPEHIFDRIEDEANNILRLIRRQRSNQPQAKETTLG